MPNFICKQEVSFLNSTAKLKNSLVNWKRNQLESITNSIEEQMFTTEKLLDLNKKFKTRKENSSMLMISMITFLIPQRDRFAAQLEQLQENIAQNRRTLSEAEVKRENDHETFESEVAEHNDAISAIDECLQLLSTIATPSLAQIKKVQKNLSKIQSSLKKHNQFQIFVKVLLEITVESNFADQGALRDIVVAFNNLRVELVDSLNQITADEAQAVTDFKNQVIQLNQEHAEFQRAVVVKNAEIEANATKIEQTLDLIDELDADLETLNGQLQAENDDYAFATDVYNATVAEYNKEINAANQALELLNQPRFQDYVKSQLKGA
ncbi:unnamed protein product (macronuclear) [Paramecium tetraurelia]|uniref:Uncharacterized protein n=1 Tax=Paramecium tetraurelia TaxID=5888 RepID=A0DAA9_PARTE|nr:uncharacterized protein GSPATT00014883001 [Paramecium tetraurelia]CAK79976.1 unnamed protein product [Paramecium tetraurelia]|eukprot:XP_001447373.1 hypothetical protein (macronuclear) [Paramecium tetraurelia strain d4-2]